MNPKMRWQAAKVLGADHPFLDDVVADAWVKAMEKIHQYDENRGMFSTWIMKITFNHAMTWKKKRKNKMLSLCHMADEGGFEPIEEVKEEYEYDIASKSYELHNKLETLSDDEKRLFKYIYFQNHKYKEAAEEFGLTIECVKSKLRRMKLKIGIDTKIYPNATKDKEKMTYRVIEKYIYLKGKMYCVMMKNKYLGSYKNLDDARKRLKEVLENKLFSLSK